MTIFFITFTILTLIVFLVAMSDNNEKRRKRWGKNEYRIVQSDYYKQGMIKTTTYYIQQKCNVPILGIKWLKVEHKISGMRDSYWITTEYGWLDQAEQAVKRLQEGHKWQGHKETIIKTIS